MRMVAVWAVCFLAGSLGGAVAGAEAVSPVQDTALKAARAIAGGKADDALPLLQTALRQYPKDADIDLVYGQICEAYLAKGNDTSAQTYCAAAILRNPNNPRPYFARAQAYYHQGRMGDARRDVDAAQGLGATKPALLGLKARLLWEDGAVREARALAMQVLARDGQEQNARFVLSAGKKHTGAAPSVAPQPRQASPVSAPGALAASAAGPVPRAKPDMPVALVPDCARPAGAARLICRDPALRGRDAQMQRLFVRARAAATDDEAYISRQRSWIAARRDVCTDKACLRAAYSERIAALGLWLCD